MKQIKVLLASVLMMAGANAFAQKVVYNYQETQARMVESYAHSYVEPLVTQMEVIKGLGEKGRDLVTGKLFLPNDEVEALLQNATTTANIRSYAIYWLIDQLEEAKGVQVDAIVSPTFFIKSGEEGKTKGFIVKIKGFPAKFGAWRKATAADYEWIRLEQTQSSLDGRNVDMKTAAEASAIKKTN